MRTWNDSSHDDLILFSAINNAVKKHPKVIDYIFDKDKPKLRDLAEYILEEAFVLSTGEYLLVKIALDMWSGSGNTNIYDMLTVLDEQNFINVLNGFLLYRYSNYKIIKVNNFSNKTEWGG